MDSIPSDRSAIVVEVVVVHEVDEIHGVVDTLVAENLRSACIAAATIILPITVGIFMANPLGLPIELSPMMIPPQHLVPLR